MNTGPSLTKRHVEESAPGPVSPGVCIPYESGGEYRSLYPDFLVVRVKDRAVVDIVDPHLIDLGDAPGKAAGLARYAAKHAPSFGRIEFIMLDGDNIQRLDLADEATRDKVRAVSTREHLRQLFQASLVRNTP